MGVWLLVSEELQYGDHVESIKNSALGFLKFILTVVNVHDVMKNFVCDNSKK
jgi:hypothetical protein